MASAHGGKDLPVNAVKEAMAYRVKYRVEDSKRAKRAINIELLCVHKDNRGGQYPTATTVENLGIAIFQDGFNRSDANHEGVCVQEVPEGRHRTSSHGVKWKTSREVNFEKTRGTALEACFPSDCNAAYGTLSHSHLVLTLLCWLNGLKWPIPRQPPHKDKWSSVLTPDGHLNKDAVASVDPELAAALVEGLTFEVLSWKMQLEEPDAARKISQALNKSHSRSLKTHERTALAVLSGAVIAETAAHGAELLFESVREKVRNELDMFVDQPDFIELFDFTINLGAHGNSFIPGLLDWLMRFVDPQQRSLRLSGFAVANKLPSWAPRTKIAIIQRSYRKNPTGGLCPDPETMWSKLPTCDIEKIEEMLYYYQVACDSLWKTWEPGKSQEFLANVAIAAADAAMTKGHKVGMKTVLLEGTLRHYKQLEGQPPASSAARKIAWIDYTAAAEKAERREAAVAAAASVEEPKEKRCLPRVITHLEDLCGEAGLQGQGQRTYEVEEETKNVRKRCGTGFRGKRGLAVQLAWAWTQGVPTRLPFCRSCAGCTRTPMFISCRWQYTCRTNNTVLDVFASTPRRR